MTIWDCRISQKTSLVYAIHWPQSRGGLHNPECAVDDHNMIASHKWHNPKVCTYSFCKLQLGHGNSISTCFLWTVKYSDTGTLCLVGWSAMRHKGYDKELYTNTVSCLTDFEIKDFYNQYCSIILLTIIIFV